VSLNINNALKSELNHCLDSGVNKKLEVGLTLTHPTQDRGLSYTTSLYISYFSDVLLDSVTYIVAAVPLCITG